MHYKILETLEFQKWRFKQEAHVRVLIANRLEKIEEEGHFGIHKYLKHNIWELKWANGQRVYYAHFPPKNILILLGGNKNGQEKDITKAKKILEKYSQKENIEA